MALSASDSDDLEKVRKKKLRSAINQVNGSLQILIASLGYMNYLSHTLDVITSEPRLHRELLERLRTDAVDRHEVLKLIGEADHEDDSLPITPEELARLRLLRDSKLEEFVERSKTIGEKLLNLNE